MTTVIKYTQVDNSVKERVGSTLLKIVLKVGQSKILIDKTESKPITLESEFQPSLLLKHLFLIKLQLFSFYYIPLSKRE